MLPPAEKRWQYVLEEIVLPSCIIGFALFQAGKMNKTALLEMQGPFRLGGDKAPVG